MKNTWFGKAIQAINTAFVSRRVSGSLPLAKEHPCFDKGHNFYLVCEIDNGYSKYGDHRCSRCGHTESFQYDYR